jgi:hypothetical protein
MSALEKPVLLLIYRRPDTTRKVLDAVRAAKPRRLFVSASGPQDEADRALVEETRAVIDEVDWDCEVHRKLWQDNQGCRINVARGITWAFDCEPEMIILEDDCVPTPAFFRFCSELLDRYRDDTRVMSISGTNFLFDRDVTPYSYFWSRYPNIWGWATWRRAWRLYDRDLALWAETTANGQLHDMFDEAPARAYWRGVMDFVADGSLDAWDYVWFASLWLHGGLAAQPTRNLVRNIGFDARATHTKKETKLSRLSVEELDFPLEHPPSLMRNREADRRVDAEVYANLPNVVRLWWYRRVQSMAPTLKNTLRMLLGRRRPAKPSASAPVGS